MGIRKYRASDIAQIARLFYDTVHSVNLGDYTSEQVDAWATGNIDLVAWNESFMKHHTCVAIEGETIVGFGDIDDTGYLDRLYVHKDFQRQGIATALCDRLESIVAVPAITVHASITALPFFHHRGYHTVKSQEVVRNGISLTNYMIVKTNN